MRTLIIVPVLGRPHRVAPLLESVEAATPEDHQVVFVATRGDSATVAALVDVHAEWIITSPHPRGDYAKKINLAADLSEDPYLFLGADDLNFHPGWLTNALKRMVEGVGVVGTNDLGNARTVDGDHSTHSLVARWYANLGTIDQPGKILHEGYWHEWVDDELVATAKHRGAYAHAKDSVVEHLHPFWGKSPSDPIYDQFTQRMRQGRIVFKQRKRLWT